jgi:pyridoxal 5'-phosphate synthase pdxT subunit
VTAPVVGVLALQGAVREHRRALESLGAPTASVRTADELAGVDALVVPGGESTAISRLAVDLDVLGPITQRIQGGMPVLGTCAGMIMLAHEVLDGRPDQRQFGGLDLTVRRNAFGRQVESFELPVDIPALGPPAFPGVFIRAPWVERAGPDVDVLATIRAGSATRIVAVRQGKVLATAFHPEITGDVRIHRLFLSMIDAGSGLITDRGS